MTAGIIRYDQLLQALLKICNLARPKDDSDAAKTANEAITLAETALELNK